MVINFTPFPSFEFYVSAPLSSGAAFIQWLYNNIDSIVDADEGKYGANDDFSINALSIDFFFRCCTGLRELNGMRWKPAFPSEVGPKDQMPKAMQYLSLS